MNIHSDKAIDYRFKFSCVTQLYRLSFTFFKKVYLERRISTARQRLDIGVIAPYCRKISTKYQQLEQLTFVSTAEQLI